MTYMNALAGTWYPANKAQLLALFDKWDSERAANTSTNTMDTAEATNNDNAASLSMPGTVNTGTNDNIGAIIVPHAGYAYSGALAASVYARVYATDVDTVLILAPSHRVAMPRAFSVEPAGDVLTPLGTIRFDKDLHAALSALPGALHVPEAHTNEHSVYIQLPFLQRYLPQCRVGAIVMGQWSWSSDENKHALAELAATLKAVCTQRTLLIISTDFTHFGESFGYRPFDDAVPERLRTLDQTLFAACAANDSTLFETLMQRTKATVCGHAPLSLLLATLPRATTMEQVGYDTSGRQTHDTTHSVSYLGALVRTDWADPLKHEVIAMLTRTPPLSTPSMQEPSHKLTSEARTAVLRLARQSLEHAVQHGTPLPLEGVSVPTALTEHRAAFVTLHAHGNLRGCIGELLPTRSLAITVAERACDAALHDTRFAPVQANELCDITLEVSVLSPPVPLASAADIVLGTHGVILQKDGHSAVFLPQVAPEQGWDVPTMLTQLALKAGLAPHAWHTGAMFFVFTADVFAE